MLPFMKNKDASVSMPVDTIKREPDEGKESEYDGLESAMQELHSSLMNKDYKGAAEIFRSCFDLLDSEPHVEGPHLNKE